MGSTYKLLLLKFMFGNTYTILIPKFDLQKCFNALITYSFQKMELFQLQRIGSSKGRCQSQSTILGRSEVQPSPVWVCLLKLSNSNTKWNLTRATRPNSNKTKVFIFTVADSKWKYFRMPALLYTITNCAFSTSTEDGSIFCDRRYITLIIILEG
jgi:hypothetical protein